MMETRQQLIARMAADIVRFKGAESERTAIAALMGRYAYGDIVTFGDQALNEARNIMARQAEW